MSDFRLAPGFEDVWRPPARIRSRRPETVLRPDGGARARLQRIAARTPEVMVKVTGRTRDAAHLAAHLTYITRNGGLAAEDRDGWPLDGRREVLDRAADWAAIQTADPRRRANSPFSVGLILSMPAGTDPLALQDAARDFARTTFGDRHDYVLVLHTDTAHPHVHLTVRALGDDGARLNPKKADLEAWRQRFAEALRDHGVAAEATPRRARGVTRKAERGPLRRMRQRHAAGAGTLGRVQAAKLRDAVRTALSGAGPASPWEARILRRQQRVRALYLSQAQLLKASPDLADQRLGAAVEAFVRGMPAPDTERLALARAIRDARSRAPPGRDRGR